MTQDGLCKAMHMMPWDTVQRVTLSDRHRHALIGKPYTCQHGPKPYPHNTTHHQASGAPNLMPWS